MKKKIIIAAILFIVLLKISFSITTLIVDETELVSVIPKAYDPDDDEVTYSYTPPLDENGEWQTNYGDAGNYNITVTVSDGNSLTTKQVILLVNKKEESPVLDSYEPELFEVDIDEGKDLYFSVLASDLNADELAYLWELDGEIVSEGNSYNYFSDYDGQGIHNISVYVSDGRFISSQEWILIVNDVDRSLILDEIEDIEIKETEGISLDLPNFASYNLKYEISEPIGDDNYWQTTYDDAGEYDITVSITDEGFEASKTITLKVNNRDRPLTFDPVGLIWMKENQNVKINLSAIDPDGDEITFSADSLPEGAYLEGNMFIWNPGYGKIKREGWFNVLLDKYHLLVKGYQLKFIASSNEMQAEQIVTIMVKDVNRPPTIEDLEDMVINEGDSFTLEPNAIDPDGDEISFKYSGWIFTKSHTTTYGDAGTYTVSITASDGWLSTSKDLNIIVKDVNRHPGFEIIPEQIVDENQTIEIALNAVDPDGDKLYFSMKNLTGASLEGNIFRYTPSFDYVFNVRESYAKAMFLVSDGNVEAEQEVLILVKDVNRAPIVEEATPTQKSTFKVNEPVVLEVKAVDPDGNRLQYLWNFGFMDTYEGRNVIKRVYTKPGTKTVKLTVSDGLKETYYEWKIDVV